LVAGSRWVPDTRTDWRTDCRSGPKRDCPGEAQQQQQITDPTSRQKGRHKIRNPRLSKQNFKEKGNWSRGPDGGLTPGQTGRLTVGRKITLTFDLLFREAITLYREIHKHILWANCRTVL
jgi:hypothetical protein